MKLMNSPTRMSVCHQVAAGERWESSADWRAMGDCECVWQSSKRRLVLWSWQREDVACHMQPNRGGRTSRGSGGRHLPHPTEQRSTFLRPFHCVCFPLLLATTLHLTLVLAWDFVHGYTV